MVVARYGIPLPKVLLSFAAQRGEAGRDTVPMKKRNAGTAARPGGRDGVSNSPRRSRGLTVGIRPLSNGYDAYEATGLQELATNLTTGTRA